MGNMFDDMNPPPLNVDLHEGRSSSLDRRHSKKDSHKKHKVRDGDSDEEDEIDLSDYLSYEERSQLNTFFRKHYSKEDGKFSTSFVSDMDIGGTNFTAGKVLNYLNHSKIDNLEKFEKFFVESVRIGSTKSFELLWQVSTTHSDHLTDAKILDFSRFIVDLSVPTLSISDSLTYAMKMQEFYITMLRTVSPHYSTHFKTKEFISIVNSYSPHAFKAYQTYILSNFISETSDETSSFRRFHPVQLTGDSDVITPDVITLLSLHNEDLQSSWKRLYSSNYDGRSFHRIVFQLLGYEGPTCILIRCSDAEKTILGAYSAEKWRDNNRFYGSAKNFLFTIHPKLRLFRSRVTSNGAFQWLNTKSYGMPHGFGFGGSLDAFRLFIPDSFENCTVSNSCVTYEPGHLLSDSRFEVDCIEIWAIGGMDKIKGGLSAQKESREVTQKNIEKARKVDKAAFFNNSFDREFLLSNTFSHQKQQERQDV